MGKLSYNREHSCPELACQDFRAIVDGCAHDVWGAGCLMYQVLAAAKPWKSIGNSNCGKEWANLYAQHKTWVSFVGLRSALMVSLPAS